MDAATVKTTLADIGPIKELKGDAPGAVIDALVAVSRMVEWEADHTFIREGDATDDHGWIVLNGRVRVVKSSGKDLTVEAPALLGEMKRHSASGQRSATVTTAQPCTALEFEWAALDQALKDALVAADQADFRIGLERYSWDYLLNEGL